MTRPNTPSKPLSPKKPHSTQWKSSILSNPLPMFSFQGTWADASASSSSSSSSAASTSASAVWKIAHTDARVRNGKKMNAQLIAENRGRSSLITSSNIKNGVWSFGDMEMALEHIEEIRREVKWRAEASVAARQREGDDEIEDSLSAEEKTFEDFREILEIRSQFTKLLPNEGMGAIMRNACELLNDGLVDAEGMTTLLETMHKAKINAQGRVSKGKSKQYSTDGFKCGIVLANWGRVVWKCEMAFSRKDAVLRHQKSGSCI